MRGNTRNRFDISASSGVKWSASTKSSVVVRLNEIKETFWSSHFLILAITYKEICRIAKSPF